MTVEVGRIRELFRYPVKSMAAQPVGGAHLNLHGLGGDRRFAFRRRAERGAVPWLTASHYPELLRFRPCGGDGGAEDPAPTHVLTPEGEELDLQGEALRAEVSRRSGHEVELIRSRLGIFDDADVSVITVATIRGIERELGRPLDLRCFRPNIVVETGGEEVFGEDHWVGGTLVFGEGDAAAAVTLTMRDPRCVMVNMHPDTAQQDPQVMRTLVRMSGNNAGVYGTVVRAGALAVGQPVRLLEPR